MKFKERLKLLGFEDYAEYLKSTHWYILRQKILAARKNCEGCQSSLHLNVHHITYKRLGEERLEDLMLACETCHEKIHEIQKERGVDILMATRFVKQLKANRSPKVTILPPAFAGGLRKSNGTNKNWWKIRNERYFSLAKEEKARKEKSAPADKARMEARLRRLSG